MRSQMKKVISLIFLMWWMLLLLFADLSRATSSGNFDNNSFIITACGDSTNCLIGDDIDDYNNGVLMNSHVARMLYELNKFKTGNTGKKNKPAVSCPPSTQIHRYKLPSLTKRRK